MKIHRVKVKEQKKDGKILREFEFHSEKHVKITDEKILTYVKKIIIPPAWRYVIVYYSSVPRYYKVLATGLDEAGRKQYIYAPWWIKKAKNVKFCQMIEFAENFPKVEQKINASIKNSRFNKNKIIALIMNIIIQCNFRIGNAKYVDLYKSYGISTLESRHIKINGIEISIKFIGKKGVLNECTFKDKSISGNLKKLKAGKKMGDRVFVYTEGGKRHLIKHTEINDWLKKISSTFTSKMFRIYQANIVLIKRLRDVDGRQLSESKRKKHTVQVYKEVAEIIHNTPAVSKKDYCDSDIGDLYIAKPRSWNNKFGSNSERVCFINWLKSKC